MIIQSGPDSPWVQTGVVSWGIGTVTIFFLNSSLIPLSYHRADGVNFNIVQVVVKLLILAFILELLPS